ncbi:MAG TPA: hydrogenase maturation nickel metallochaperone HypA [Pseudomonadota bacterium]|nr:hydrogenase maturation nickel metallochaperone HypA [Pseudomonadota bacterium]
MHELSLALSLLRLVSEAASHAGASRVKRVMLDVGEGSGVHSEALTFCFQEAARGTLAEGAEILVKRVPLKLHCRHCLKTSSPSEFRLVCEACGESTVDLCDGLDLSVSAIDIETENSLGVQDV